MEVDVRELAQACEMLKDGGAVFVVGRLKANDAARQKRAVVGVQVHLGEEPGLVLVVAESEPAVVAVGGARRGRPRKAVE